MFLYTSNNHRYKVWFCTDFSKKKLKSLRDYRFGYNGIMALHSLNAIYKLCLQLKITIPLATIINN